jgi:NADH-quinone oxidoreductase subunit J
MINFLLFSLFALLMIISALGVITVRRSVHAVFCLISAFINAAGLFILLGAEFLAMILLIVYVGAVTVLFLFVVMMLDTDKEAYNKPSVYGKWLGIGAGVFLMTELALIFILSLFFSPGGFKHQNSKEITLITTKDIGRVLYTDYFFPFQMGGVILLVAIFGAIVLTLHHRQNVKRQDTRLQLQRMRENAIEICSVPFYEGLETPNSLTQSIEEKRI